MINSNYTPSKVTDNPFGISWRLNWTFIAMGGPQAHENSKWPGRGSRVLENLSKNEADKSAGTLAFEIYFFGVRNL